VVGVFVIWKGIGSGAWRGLVPLYASLRVRSNRV